MNRQAGKHGLKKTSRKIRKKLKNSGTQKLSIKSIFSMPGAR